MNMIRFHLEQAVLLGTVAFGCLVVTATLLDGTGASVSAPTDALFGLFMSWIFMLVLLIVVVSPVQLAMRRFRAGARKEIWAGALSGIAPVILLFALAGGGSGNPWLSLLAIVPFGLVGGWFAFNLRRQLGPN